MQPDPSASTGETARLRRRLERERSARLEAEAVSERGLRELYERKQQLELLEKVADAANQSIRSDETLRLVLTEVCAFTSWEIGHVYHVEGAGPELRLRSTRIWQGADGDKVAAFRRLTEETIFTDGVGLPGRTLTTGKAAWIRDLRADDNFPRHRCAQDCDLRAAAAFPVLSGDEVVAVFEFFTYVTREPDDTLLRLMSQIGLHIGRVIEREHAALGMRRRTEELERARDQAHSASRAKSAFLANMSHELRTPLNSIIGFSEVMMQEMFGAHGVAAYKGYSKYIYDSGLHLLAIINDVLDLSKIEAGKAQLDREDWLALTPILEEMKQIIGAEAEKKGITFLVSAPADLPYLIGSERMIRQILMNLLSNAIEFTPAGGSVAVSAAVEAGGRLVLSVTDSGVGMNQAEIEIALQPFSQVDSDLDRRHGGTGLGLPLARAMAELHQAQFRITSIPGSGTTIEIAFPRPRLALAEPANARTESGTNRGSVPG